MERAEAFHVGVDGAVQVGEVNLGDLVLTLQLQLVLQSDNVFEELSEFEPSALAEPEIWLKRVSNIALSHPPVHVGLELWVLGLDQVQEVRIAHLLDPVLCIDRELSLHRQLHVRVGEADVEVLGQVSLQIAQGQELLSWADQCFENVVD